MSHKKFGPDRFSRFDVYWIQTNKQTNKQTNRQTDKPNLYIDTHSVVCPIHQSQHKVLLHIYLLALAHLEYPVHCTLNPARFVQQMRPAKSLCTYINNKMSQINTGKYSFIVV